MVRGTAFLIALVATPALAQSGPPYRVPVRGANEIAEITREFEKSFKQDQGIEVTIRNCTHIVDLAVGVKDGNNSYGAICEVEIGPNKRMMMMCNDRMVGHFAVKTGLYNITHNITDDDYVAKFTEQNCYGG